MAPSSACTAIIQRFEGFAKVRDDGMVEAYPDPASGGDPWTIGAGLTGDNITEGTVWTREQCGQELALRIADVGAKVDRAIGSAATTQNEFDALTSFAFNLGLGALLSSTLFQKHRQGDYAGAGAEFGKWIHGGGRVMPGLVRRRAAEAQLYLGEA
jgi:lysozyme